MHTRPQEPIEVAMEMALRDFSIILLWVFLPGTLLLLLTSPENLLWEPLRLPVFVLIPIIGVLIRPSPSRPLPRRGRIALGGVVFICLLMLVKAGPRQPNVVGCMAMAFSLAALFGGVRWLNRLTLLFAGGAVLGVLLRGSGIVDTPVYPPQIVADELIRLTLGITMCVFVARIGYTTVDIYRGAYLREQSTGAKLLEAERTAQRLQRQELAATMARGMAHDLANFLQVMTGSVELMKRADDRDTRLKVAADTTAMATRATTTLRALLTVGKVSATGDGCTDIVELFERLETLIPPIVRSRIQVTISCRATGRVAMNAEQLEQVLLNLTFNARDAMPEGGTLTITAERVVSAGVRDADVIRILVADTGMGIPAALLPRIFDPYMTTKDVSEGTGLGLAIVARAVEDAGGQIEVTSDEGAGTTFDLRLPMR